MPHARCLCVDCLHCEQFTDNLQCSRFGNLCDNTVALPPAEGTGVAPPCFTVLDLRKSPFCSAPYVTGPLAMKFYCGTPVTTPKHLNIGSLVRSFSTLYWISRVPIILTVTDRMAPSGFSTIVCYQNFHMNKSASSARWRAW